MFESIRESRKIVFMIGAGISVASGLPTFTGPNAVSAEWLEDNELTLLNAFPNEAHKSIYDISTKFNVAVITQNVDGLHEKAGSEPICLHKHADGSFIKFGESVDQEILEQAVKSVLGPCVYICIGTRHLVFPAVTITDTAIASGNLFIDINMKEEHMHPETDIKLQGPAEKILPLLRDELFKE